MINFSGFKRSIFFIILFPFIGWIFFFSGFSINASSVSISQKTWLLMLTPGVVLLILFGLLMRSADHLPSWLARHFESFETHITSLPKGQLAIWITFGAALSLFLELSIIRLHSSYFQLFAYLKNFSLLSCFLGLGIGYALGGRILLTLPLFMPLFTFQLVFLSHLRQSVIEQHRWLKIPSYEQVFYGIGIAQHLQDYLLSYGFIVLVFVLNALLCIPVGQVISVMMERMEKLPAYGWNLLGSLVGIILFSLISFAWTPPIVWVILIVSGIMLLQYRHLTGIVVSLGLLALILLNFSAIQRTDRLDIYSPYQILSLRFQKDLNPVLETGNVFFQQILNLSDESVNRNSELALRRIQYDIPYQFRHSPENVLVVGSGTGNDVVAALRNAAGHVDAVEIDPAILAIGRDFHPETPYQNEKVQTFVNDAREFIRSTDRKYDLVVYGLLDSHSLVSSVSGGIRLDSYVYTVEAFREARRVLKPGGVIALSFGSVGPLIWFKIHHMLQMAFDGVSPGVFKVREHSFAQSGFTFVAGTGQDGTSLSVPENLLNASAEFEAVSKNILVTPSTDDWPFLYMFYKSYPVSYLMMFFVILLLSLMLVTTLTTKETKKFHAPSFFLGVGFMLLETKAITELALLFGSTWVVISVVIACILMMAFFANAVVQIRGTPPAPLAYSLLLATLLLGYFVTQMDGSNLSPWVAKMMMPILLTLPLFFSGFAFSTELAKGPSLSTAISSNLLGAMLGGTLEYNAMFFGYRALYLFAMIFYLAAFFFSTRKQGHSSVM